MDFYMHLRVLTLNSYGPILGLFETGGSTRRDAWACCAVPSTLCTVLIDIGVTETMLSVTHNEFELVDSGSDRAA